MTTPEKKLPNGWQWVKLGDVCSIISTTDPRREPDNEFIYIDISSIDRITKKIVSPSVIVGKSAPSRARRIVNKGDVLVATTRPNLNAVALVGDDLNGQICSTGLCVLRPKIELLDSRFLYHYTMHREFVNSLSELVSGAMYPAVTDKQVFDQIIPLPPLVEQRRIVVALEAQMAMVERARKAAEEILEAVKALSENLPRKFLP